MLRGHRRLAVDAHDRAIVAADVVRQVGRRHPRVAAVVRAEQPIAAEIDRARVVRREDERRVPVEAEVRARRRRRHDVAVRVAAAAAELRGSAAEPVRIRALGGPPGCRAAGACGPPAGCCRSGRSAGRRGWSRRPATRSTGSSSRSDRCRCRSRRRRRRGYQSEFRMPFGAARRARAAPAPVVLQPAADVVGLPHVGADRVELADRRRCSRTPTSRPGRR